MKDDFEGGREAYFFAEDDILLDCNAETRAGFKDAWYDNEGRRYDQFGDNAADAAFDNFVDQVVAANRQIPAPKNLDHLKGTCHEFLIKQLEPKSIVGTAGMMLLGIALASVFALIVLAPWLMDAREVAEFWRGM